ncbi:MAG: mechanosensitive ion channel [Alphaproteobacteria bacterium]|nr:mechanosensitive ion channel [Alphaproteobacteria bacterium]
MSAESNQATAEINKVVDNALTTFREMQENGELDILLQWGMNLISAILILIAGWMLGHFLAKRIQSLRRLDETLASFLATFVRYAVMIVAIITILGQFGVQTASLLAVMGAAGLAIGLALQGTLSNVAAGAMLLILRPFKVGDYIVVDNVGGTVKSLGLFGTELATPDNVYIFTPNSMIWNNDIWNYTRNALRRQDVLAGISYNDDINKAFGIIMKILHDDERIITNDETKKPEVMVDKMADFSIDLIARFWSKKEDYWNLRWDITKRIKEDFDAAGITIPFPTRTLEMVEKKSATN